MKKKKPANKSGRVSQAFVRPPVFFFKTTRVLKYIPIVLCYETCRSTRLFFLTKDLKYLHVLP